MASTDHPRILLVEDHHDTAFVVRLVLEQQGYEVVCAHSCGDAHASAEGARLDLLICDIGLPDGNGVDLLQALTLERSLPAIAVSGYGTPDDIRRSLDAGFVAHLTKPFGMRSLIEAVERALA
ncbi:MAG TPA: response regulator [Candidatus Kapabacteria bacterium]|jgi:CheY-like chemotaxis protein|nr:response regulator [Candidatus Kapabacteria bacterium]